MRSADRSELLRGTLELMILRALMLESLHGYGIRQRLLQMTEGVFDIQAGSLFPALYRLVGDGRIEGDWGVSDNNRKAKFYKLTGSGRRKLDEETRNWRRVSLAIDRLLGVTAGGGVP